MLKQQVPLAWKNLTHQVSQLLIAAAGIGFAVVLMFMQTGFQNALYDSTVEVIRQLDADLIVVSRACYSLSSARRFSKDRLNLAAGVDGVAFAQPLYLETFGALLRSSESARTKRYPIRAIGFDTTYPLFDNEGILRQQRLLRSPRTALFDRRSKTQSYAVDARRLSAAAPEIRELAGKRVALVGSFELSTDFANEGNLIVSRETFADLFPFRGSRGSPLDLVDVGAIKCRPGANVADVQRRLKETFRGQGVLVWRRGDFVKKEISYWSGNTPIGVIFTFGVVMGFIVGVIICYQIIYSDLADHMPEFATLKAMGYPPRYFVGVVICESLYLSFLGYVPGVLVSGVLFQVLRANTGLLMQLTLPRALFILGLTIAMCIVSGVVAIRKLQSADPVSLF